MVAVPRSKGCLICKTRAVKCDEARPSCSQCRRGGRKCPGYDQPLTFIVHDTGRYKPSKVTQSMNEEVQSPHASKRSLPNKVVKSNPTPIHQLYELSLWEPRTIPRMGSVDLNRIQLISSFVSNISPPETLHPQLSFFADWMWSVPQHIAKSPQLDYAALSLALSFFAQQSQNEPLQQRSMFAYAKALGYLSRAINSPDSGYASETLCATMLLSLYEMFMCTEKTSWVKHAGGAGRLMQIRGAKRHREGFDYTMFLGFRGTLIGEAIASGEQCFLARDDWAKVVTENSGYAASSTLFRFYNDFTNLYASIPGVVEELSKAIRAKNRKNFYSFALANGTGLRARFLDWHSRFMASFPPGSQPIVEACSTAAGTPFPLAYECDNMWTAIWVCSCYACLILLNSRIGILRGIDVSAENDELVTKICMFAEYLGRSGMCGIHCLAFALPVALSVCKDDLKSWIGEVLARISGGAEVPQPRMRFLED